MNVVIAEHGAQRSCGRLRDAAGEGNEGARASVVTVLAGQAGISCRWWRIPGLGARCRVRRSWQKRFQSLKAQGEGALPGLQPASHQQGDNPPLEEVLTEGLVLAFEHGDVQ
jgi:hypothetical protein